jgi:hypothetical protein
MFREGIYCSSVVVKMCSCKQPVTLKPIYQMPPGKQFTMKLKRQQYGAIHVPLHSPRVFFRSCYITNQRLMDSARQCKTVQDSAIKMNHIKSVCLSPRYGRSSSVCGCRRQPTGVEGLNNQSRTTDSGWSSSSGVGPGFNTAP